MGAFLVTSDRFWSVSSGSLKDCTCGLSSTLFLWFILFFVGSCLGRTVR